MADTGEKRQITRRTNAKEAETVRASKKILSRERSTVKETDAAFDMLAGRAKGLQGRTKGSKQRSGSPKASR